MPEEVRSQRDVGLTDEVHGRSVGIPATAISNRVETFGRSLAHPSSHGRCERGPEGQEGRAALLGGRRRCQQAVTGLGDLGVTLDEVRIEAPPRCGGESQQSGLQ